MSTPDLAPLIAALAEAARPGKPCDLDRLYTLEGILARTPGRRAVVAAHVRAHVPGRLPPGSTVPHYTLRDYYASLEPVRPETPKPRRKRKAREGAPPKRKLFELKGGRK